MPEVRGDDGNHGSTQRHLAEARQQPQRNAHSGGQAKTVKQRVVPRRLQAAIGQPGAIRQKVRRVKLDGGHQTEHRADDQPERRAAKERQQRHATGTVNLHRQSRFRWGEATDEPALGDHRRAGQAARPTKA